MVSRQCLYSGFILAFSVLLAGCVSTTPPPALSTTAIPKPPQDSAIIYHYTQKGETLWRIAKKYNVDIDELLKLNHISDCTKIETGQLIFIPRSRNGQDSSSHNLNNEDFIWPLKGRIISRFGDKNESVINKGIDIQAPYGREVVASRSGIVSFCDEKLKSFGKTVIIDHGDGFLTVYARNSDLFVKAGDKVSQGTLIAKVGSAGKDKTSFLHFEIRKGHTPQNPYYYLSN